MAAAIAGDLAPDAHIAEPVFDGALERVRQLADRDFGRIGGTRVRFCHRLNMLDSPRESEVGLSLWRVPGKPRMKPRAARPGGGRLVHAAMSVSNGARLSEAGVGVVDRKARGGD